MLEKLLPIPEKMVCASIRVARHSNGNNMQGIVLVHVCIFYGGQLASKSFTLRGQKRLSWGQLIGEIQNVPGPQLMNIMDQTQN